MNANTHVGWTVLNVVYSLQNLICLIQLTNCISEH